MILDEVLNLGWTPYGIQCSNVTEAKRYHKFLREAVLDNHICLHKVIGFQITSSIAHRRYTGVYIARHQQIGESYPQLVVNMLDKVFVGIDRDYAKCLLKLGDNTLENNKFNNGRTVEYDVLYTDPTICRCLFNKDTANGYEGNTYFNVKLAYASGYRSMHENSKIVGDKFFPCYTDFSLREFVRVLPMPPGSTFIPIRFYNGMTLEKFLLILKEWRTHIGTGNISQEDLLWLQQGYVQ